MCADSSKNRNAVQKVTEVLKKLNIPLVKNFDIIGKHLRDRSLHLNKHGMSRLALNYTVAMRKL